VSAGYAVNIMGFSCRYGADEPLRLHQVSLKVKLREFVAIVGPSGGGKSSLAYAINGIIPHEIRGSETAGYAFVLDFEVARHPPHALVQAVGTVLQDPEWQLVTFTVEDEIAFGLENLGFPAHEIRERVASSAKLLGIRDLLDRSPDELSGGQKQRVAIAAGLSMSPPILLLDEPLSELDPAGKRAVMEAVSSLNRDHELTILLVEHNLDEIAPYADRVVVLSDGEIVASGSPREVLGDQETLRTARLRAPQPMEVAALFPPALRHAKRPLSAEELAGSLPTPGAARSLAPPKRLRPVPLFPKPLPIAVKAEGLRYRYPGGIEAIRGIDLTIREGEYIGLIGQNGAGKSTLARLLAGLLRPERGGVALGGRPISGLSREEIVARVGYVFQNPDYQFFSKSCFEEVAFGPRLRKLPEAEVERRAISALEQLEVDGYRDEHPHFLSRGQRRRVAIASMLALEPEVIVLDEPTTGLDTGTASRLLNVVDGLRDRGHTIVMLTHEMRAVLERCDRLVLVHDGQVVLDDDPRKAFKERITLEECGIRPPPLARLVEELPWCSPLLLPRTSQEAATLVSNAYGFETKKIGGTT